MKSEPVQAEWEKSMLTRLAGRFPVFDYAYEWNDDSVYMCYGGFGSFILAVIYAFRDCDHTEYNYYEQTVQTFYTSKDKLEQEILFIFEFVEELFDDCDERTRDVLNCCIFEALMGSSEAELEFLHHMSPEIINYYKGIRWSS